MMYPAEVIICTPSRERGGIKMRCPNPTASIGDRERKTNVRMRFAQHDRLRNRIYSGAHRNIALYYFAPKPLGKEQVYVQHLL